MMDRIEQALTAAVAKVERTAPPLLGKALRHAVFPGGARVRPRLCLAVAEACGDDAPALADAAAAGLELLHCASLVHDDLPCFDNAAMRRGRPSVHSAFGEPLAVLVGDGLIVMSFEGLAQAAGAHADRLAPLVMLLARSAGPASGLVAGQAWESEPHAPLHAYHQAKTGSLFTAATMAGALAAGHNPAPWRAMGQHLGEAYQVADDLLDAVALPHEAGGKPTLQDVARGRPSAVVSLGVAGAVTLLRGLVGKAVEAVPACAGQDGLRALVGQVAARLVPDRFKNAA